MKQRTDTERRALVDEWQASGETAVEFCNRHGIYFCATVGAVTDELIKEYIANQDIEDGNDDFKVSDEFQS